MNTNRNVVWMCREPRPTYTANVERLYADVSVADFLGVVFHTKEDTDQIATLKFKGDPGESSNFRKPYDQTGDPEHVKVDSGGNNYFCVSSFPQGFGARNQGNAGAFHVLVLDDPTTKAEAAVVLAALGEPTYKIQTSASDQWGYVLEEPPPPWMALKACKAIKRKGLGDPAGNNTVRWVRLPAGINMKPGASNFKVRLTAWNPQTRLSLDEMCAALEVGTDDGKDGNEGNGTASGDGDKFDLTQAIDEILEAVSFHDNIIRLAAHYAATGMKAKQVTINLQRLMNVPKAKTDPARWQARYDAIPKSVESAFAKYARKRTHTISVAVGRSMEVVEELRPLLAELREFDVYVYGNKLVEPYMAKRSGRRGPDGKVTSTQVLALATITYPTFKNLLTALAEFVAKKQKDGKWIEQAAEVPETAAMELYTMPGRWEAIQTIERITETPLLIGDKLFSKPGFHEGIWINAPEITLPELTKANAMAALRRVEKWLEEFPLDDANRAGAVALLLTSAMRASLDLAPGFVLSKPAYGSGASTLTDLASIVHCGRHAPCLGLSANEEENRKVIQGELHSGASFMNLDNLPDGTPFESPLLGQVLSQLSGKVRVMGKNNEQPVIPFGRMVILNGNNVAAGADLARRILIVRLDPRMAHPEERTFRRTNLLDDAIRERETILTDLFTIAAAYAASGQKVKVNPLVGYDEFRERIAAPLKWLGCPDVIESISTRAAPDETCSTLEVMLPLWQQLKDNKNGLTVKEAIEHAGLLGHKAYSEFQRQLAQATKVRAFGGTYELDPIQVGYWLRRVRDRVVDGHRFEHVKKNREGTQLWRVTCIADPCPECKARRKAAKVKGAS